MAHSDLVFRTNDDPEAHGRKPEPGDTRYEIWFDTEKGNRVTVQFGPAGLASFKQMIRQLEVDDALDDALKAGD